MFGQLKSRLSGFVGKLIGRKEDELEKTDEQQKPQKVEEPVLEKEEKNWGRETNLKIEPAQRKEEQVEKKKIETESLEKPQQLAKARPQKKTVGQEHSVKKEQKLQEPKAKTEKFEVVKEQNSPELKTQIDDTVRAVEDKKTLQKEKTIGILDIAKGVFAKKEEEKPAFERVTESIKKKSEAPKIEFVVPQTNADKEDIDRLEKKALDGKKEQRVKVGVGKSIGSIFSKTITVEKKDIEDLLDELELSLIESDVGLEVSQEVKNRLEKKLDGLKVEKSKMQEEINRQIKQVLVDIMKVEGSAGFDAAVERAKKPVKILFVGPNGAGKTTTIAKIAHRLQNRGKTVCFAAADTFRAAAIEQLSVHAQRLGVDIIKSNYGADPASVAFDAIKHARANNIDVVLIDSAGRQDTNANLIDEMKKIHRVVAPDLKIYVGESIGGSALISQISTFNEAIGIDGAILTKLDCDAKGGTAISLTYTTSVPIMFIGVGQEYDDLELFDANKIAEQILA